MMLKFIAKMALAYLAVFCFSQLIGSFQSGAKKHMNSKEKGMGFAMGAPIMEFLAQRLDMEFSPAGLMKKLVLKK